MAHVRQKAALCRRRGFRLPLRCFVFHEQRMLALVILLHVGDHRVKFLLHAVEVVTPAGGYADIQVAGAHGAEGFHQSMGLLGDAAADDVEAQHGQGQARARTEDGHRETLRIEEVPQLHQRLAHNEGTGHMPAAGVQRRRADQPVVPAVDFQAPAVAGVIHDQGAARHHAVNEVVHMGRRRVFNDTVRAHGNDRDRRRLCHRRSSASRRLARRHHLHLQPEILQRRRNVHRLQPHPHARFILPVQRRHSGELPVAESLAVELHLPRQCRRSQVGALHKAQRDELLPEEPGGRRPRPYQHRKHAEQREAVGDLKIKPHDAAPWVKAE